MMVVTIDVEVETLLRRDRQESPLRRIMVEAYRLVVVVVVRLSRRLSSWSDQFELDMR